ncbi:DNRLRE domain-containing protein [Cerasicoccus frondis]|uniref:DNRLRE domain-containing protein n=1 Tax=Cerasicoccus frondis TaxID=490090 RepID=UPI00285269AF|nr:DNRLRE domain-containing protein [Cerasicoccus frondis]
MKTKSIIRSALTLFALPMLLAATSLLAETLPLSKTTFIRSGVYSDKNYDKGGTLEVAARGGNNSRKIYLQAEVNELLSTRQQFSESKLILMLFSRPLLGEPSGKVNFNVYGVVSPEAFDVADINWGNAPENDDASATDVLATGTVMLGAITINTNSVEPEQLVSLDGKNLDVYLNWVAGKTGDVYHTGASNGVASFIITCSGSQHDAGVTFYSNSQPVERRPTLSYQLKPN